MRPQSIPIQNLYYLLSYAWNQLDQAQIVEVQSFDSRSPKDLFAHVLSAGVEHIVRRGLDRDYETIEDDLSGIRGRLEMLQTARKFRQQHARAICRFDELTENTVANRIIRQTLKNLARDLTVDRSSRSRAMQALQLMPAVSEIHLDRHHFRQVQLHSNNGFYRFLINICEFVHSSLLPGQAAGNLRFRDFFRDERKMAYVFQYFVYNFIRREFTGGEIVPQKIDWLAHSDNDPALDYLPRMVTDVTINSGDRQLIIDTKYYRETLSNHHGVEKIHSGNLYQVVSYLANAKAHNPRKSIRGMLLYPTVEHDLDLKYEILGMSVSIRTLNLDAPWQFIRSSLLDILRTSLEEPTAAAS